MVGGHFFKFRLRADLPIRDEAVVGEVVDDKLRVFVGGSVVEEDLTHPDVRTDSHVVAVVFIAEQDVCAVQADEVAALPFQEFDRFFGEQAGVAERVSQLGAGIKLTGTDAASVINATEKILADGGYKLHAAEIAAGFRRCSGAKGAADKILQVCEKNG